MSVSIDRLSGLRKMAIEEDLARAAKQVDVTRQSFRGHSLYEGPSGGGSGYQLVVFTGHFMVRIDGNLPAEPVRAAVEVLDFDRLDTLASE